MISIHNLLLWSDWYINHMHVILVIISQVVKKGCGMTFCIDLLYNLLDKMDDKTERLQV